MKQDDLVKAFWGRLEIRLSEYGYTSLRNFCYKNGMNYQVIVAARRKGEFPPFSDVITFSCLLDIDINALLYGKGYDEVLDDRSERIETRKALKRRFQNITEALCDADPIRIAAIEIILGIYDKAISQEERNS